MKWVILLVDTIMIQAFRLSFGSGTSEVKVYINMF